MYVRTARLGGLPPWRKWRGRTRHDPSLVVEVTEDDVDPLVLLAQEVLGRDLHVVKGDVCSARGRAVRRLDRLGLHALSPFNEKHAEGLAGSHACHKVVGEAAIGDPLLGPVDDLEQRLVSSLLRTAYARGGHRSSF